MHKGDQVQISFSGSMNNPIWCIDDGWEADFSIHDSAGGQIIQYPEVMIMPMAFLVLQCQLQIGFTSK